MNQYDKVDGEQDRHRSFQRFFESWIPKQDCHALRAQFSWASRMKIIDRVIMHYELYHKFKSMWSSYHVVPSMLLLPLLTTLDGPVFWADGWRPTLAFHILYSKSGVQMENRLLEILDGKEIGDLGDLSESQLIRLEALQKEVAREEDWISDNLKAVHEDAVQPRKVARLRSLVRMADGLRMATLMKMDAILTPLQRTHFRISGVELELGIHEWAQSRFAYRQAPGDGGSDQVQEDDQARGNGSGGDHA